MSYYLIGIGGTGAKCVNAFIHLCAAGLMPEDDLFVMFVDPDRSNGSLDQAQQTLKLYTKCERSGGDGLFRSRVTIADPDVWSPFGRTAQPRLDEFFHYNQLKLQNAGAARLFDVLYSDEEKSTPLDQGFRGHPSIGAAVMAKTVALGAEEPWKTFRDKVSQDVKSGAGAKILLIGSIFGGTGASGVPTIARLIRDELQQIGQKNARIGCVLMLPYFSFSPVESEKLRADSQDFLLNTQAALHYYQQDATDDEMKRFNAVYLLGEESLTQMKQSSIGGPTQRNEPHFIELYAGLAALDFFQREDAAGYRMVARQQKDRVRWNDLPFDGGTDEFKQKINHLARFAFAYLSVYYPMLLDIKQKGDDYRAPWYVDLIKRDREIKLDRELDGTLKDIKEYCESFLLWLASVQTSSPSTDMVELVNWDAFAYREGNQANAALKLRSDFHADAFENLVLPAGQEERNGLDRLWRRMSEAKSAAPNATGISRFIRALYRECAPQKG